MPRTSASPTHAAQVGAAMRQARTEIGLSQVQLAERLEVSPAYVNKLEVGRANPTVGMLARVAAALGAELRVGFDAQHQPTASAVERLLG